MARYTGPREKIERRLGEKLFLKGERSYSGKSATVKKPYPPGIRPKGAPRKMSEFGLQLKSKQKVRNIYRLLEKQFKNHVKKSIASKHDTYEAIVSGLESRLDNTVYRMGLGQSRDQARQLVTHGHITVNGKKSSIPSSLVKPGDEIGVREGSRKSPFFSTLAPQWIKKYEAPGWMSVDKDKLTAKVRSTPTMQDSGLNPNDLQAIIEYYSR